MTRISQRNAFLAVLIALSVFFLILHLAAALRPAQTLMMWYHIDDAYYYFQVARNAALNCGFTFDGIGWSNGFHPLWMLVNLPVFYFARINPFLPFRILILVSALITLGGAWLLFNLLRKCLRPEAALLGFTAWLFFWPIHAILTQTGMEAGLNAFFLVLLLWTVQKTDWGAARFGFLWLGIAAAGVLLARLDNLFLVILFGIWLVFHQLPMRNLLLLDALVWFITVLTSIILRVGIDSRLAFTPAAEAFFVVLAAARAITFYIFGLYRNPHDFSIKQLLLRILAATAISSAVLFLLIIGLLNLEILPAFPRSAVLIEGALALAVTSLVRTGFRLLSSAQQYSNLSMKTNALTWLRKGILYLLPIVLFLSAYLVWSQRTFGTPMPISGQIKQWWGTLLTVYGRKHSNLWTIFGILPNTREDAQPWFLLRQYFFTPFYNLFQTDPFTHKLPFLAVKLSLAALYGGLLAWIYKKHNLAIKRIMHHLSIAPTLTAAVLLPLYYAFTGYLAMRDWYWIPQIILTLLLFLVLMHTLLEFTEKQGQVLNICGSCP